MNTTFFSLENNTTFFFLCRQQAKKKKEVYYELVVSYLLESDFFVTMVDQGKRKKFHDKDKYYRCKCVLRRKIKGGSSLFERKMLLVVY
jgi:hypothetical protein